MKTSDLALEKIRIGTLVNAQTKKGKTAADYISQILPYGFESFSLTFWQTLGDTNLKKLAQEVNKALEGSGAIISSVGIFGNPLETQSLDRATADGFKKLIDHAHLFGTNIVAGFAGRVRGKSIPDSMPRFKKIFEPLGERAADKGVLIAFENCAMGGNWQSGDWNIAHNPSAWQLMFDAVPSKNIGLQWEPCHQMVELIDPMPQLREWSKKIFHVHGKDATIHWDLVHKYGIGGAKQFAFHRTPGFGDSNWTEIISELRRHGYTGCIDIEGWHDPVYRDELEMTGQVHALNYLKQCRGGSYVPNPK
jgi:sugar phosphate isomerase/epimerase